ncbi:MAG: DUF4439 domain-containing protein [Candidatus Nanopelagicales bacterium]
MADDPHVSALQAALAGEHAAVWGCGRAAGELTGSDRTHALDELDDHRRARDDLRAQVVALGGKPVEAAPAYAEPFEVTGRKAARQLLAQVGVAVCATYADLAAASPQGARRAVAKAASASAGRAIAWGAEPEAFPGA